MTIDIKLQLTFLKELQSADAHVREIVDILAEIPDQLEEAKERLLEASTILRAKEAEKAEAETEKRHNEAGLEDSLAHLKEREAKLYAIKTNKEYQAALKEIADGKKANKEREDAVLRLMEKIEQLSQEITQLSGKAAEEEVEFKKEEEELSTKKVELEKEKRIKEAEVLKLEEKVDKEVLEKFNSIRTRYADPLAAVERGICSGCNMNIPPQMYIELLKAQKFHFCPNCYRFVYPEDKKEETDET